MAQIKEYGTAANYMAIGVDFCIKNNIKYAHILFILCKGLVS